MKSEAAEQVTAPAETRNTQLIKLTIECGWKGGVSLKLARKTGSDGQRRASFVFLAR
jgi:hypothetical protein